jgi:hypothetical protein
MDDLVAKDIKTYKSNELTVDYIIIGTVTIDELFKAIYEDFQALKDIHDVRFVKGAQIKLPVTDGYGQPLTVRRENGSPMYRMHTYHHKPVCEDYDL